MSNDWASGHSDNSENSDEYRVIAFMYRAKTISSDFFYDTWNCLEVTIPSSELSIFALYPKTITWNFTFTYGTMLGSENSKLSSFALY